MAKKYINLMISMLENSSHIAIHDYIKINNIPDQILLAYFSKLFMNIYFLVGKFVLINNYAGI
jgi:hypothetical protein